MDATKKKVFVLTQKLRMQPDVALWKLANENVIYSVAMGRKTVWGPRLSILCRVMELADKINTADFIIFFVGMLRATAIWWSVKKRLFTRKKIKKNSSFDNVFSGFGASSEEYLYVDYISQSKGNTLRINWATQGGVHHLGCPSLADILCLVFQNAFGQTNKLKNSIDEVSSNAVDFMTVCAANIAAYSFYRSFWKMAKWQGVKEVATLALDVPAYACVDEGISTIYLQHGLMALSILIPEKLDCINALTADEELFFKATSGVGRINRVINIAGDIGERNDVLMMMSMNVFQEERLLACEPLIQWAEKIGLQILIRPTPAVTRENLNLLLKRIPGSLCDNLADPLSVSFEKWRPKLVTAWTSTGLATALDYGCLPISLCNPEDNDLWGNMIYPMKERVLFWPRDKGLIEAAIQSKEVYCSQLKTLRNHRSSFYLESTSLA